MNNAPQGITPMQQMVNNCNQYYDTKKQCLLEKHNLEMTDGMIRLLDTKEKLEQKGYSKEKILHLIPSLKTVYDINTENDDDDASKLQLHNN